MAAQAELVRERVAAGTVLALDRCVAGAEVEVQIIDESDDDGCRLRELGLYEGARVSIVSHGDPVVLCVFSNRFAVCRRCARHVTVRVM